MGTFGTLAKKMLERMRWVEEDMFLLLKKYQCYHRKVFAFRLKKLYKVRLFDFWRDLATARARRVSGSTYFGNYC